MKLCTDKYGTDKIYHLLCGGAIALLVGITYAHFFPFIPWLTVAVTLSAVLAAAVFWEIYRKRMLPQKHICIWDVLWTLAGGISVCWAPWLVTYMLAVNG